VGSILLLLRLLSAAFGLLILIGVIELAYIVLDVDRFRAARAYIYLKVPQLRIAFLTLLVGVIFEIAGGTLIMLAAIGVIPSNMEAALALITVGHLAVFIGLQLLYFIFSGRI